MYDKHNVIKIFGLSWIFSAIYIIFEQPNTCQPVQAVVIIEVKRNSRLIREDLPSHDSN